MTSHPIESRQECLADASFRDQYAQILYPNVEGARHGLGKTLALSLDEATICKQMSLLGPQPCWPKLLQFCSKFFLAALGCATNEIIAAQPPFCRIARRNTGVIERPH